jgi:hypothetical protein
MFQRLLQFTNERLDPLFEVGMGHGNRLQPNRRSIVEP